MKVAIVGAGISGLTAAYRLAPTHDVQVFEANKYIGGHTNTIDVEEDGQTLSVDTGFIVFNDRTYPNFCQLLGELGVEAQPTTMSFSVQCERSNFEYRGASASGFFAQRRNLLNINSYLLLRDFWRFNRQADRESTSWDSRLTVGQFFQDNRYSDAFVERYFLPMASAIWSCPRGTIEAFPIRFIAEFYRNHGLLSVTDHPQWQVVKGGSRTYVNRILESTNATFHTGVPVRSVAVDDGQVRLCTDSAEARFDHVIMACHSDQALAIRGDDARMVEREVVGAFPYERNVALLHTDVNALPRCHRAWACWNYFLPTEPTDSATVTYNMNLLQSLDTDQTYCVTLNDNGRVSADKVLREIVYHHPVFTAERDAAQSRHEQVIDAEGISYCGAYWGNGFHEDGVKSALAVVKRLEAGSECTPVSTKVS